MEKILPSDNNIHSKVADILRNIGREKCLKKAELLANSENTCRSLNLRGLDLSAAEVKALAYVLKDIDGKGDSAIESISFSYNHSLRDEGAIALMKLLPDSIRELGLVNCGISETGGLEILNWMKNATNLGMICTEQNSFSDELKSEFVKFRVENPGIIVVI